jgi:hypothetical protein
MVGGEIINMVLGRMEKSRRNLALAMLVVAVLILAINQFTGFFAEILDIGISVAASSQASVSIVDMPAVTYEGERANILIALDNMGSQPLVGAIYIEIRDPLNSTVDSFSSSQYSVQPGSYITDTVMWTPSLPLGNYTIYAWDNLTDPTGLDWQNFSVQCHSGTIMCSGDERIICSGYSWSLIELCSLGCQNGACLTESPGPSGGGAGAPAGPSVSYPMYSG